MSLLNYFPESEVGGPPRPQQVEGMKFVDGAFGDNVKIVVLEMPVGSGKSGLGMAASRAYGGGIVACPTVQLQKQYLSEFENTAPLIGRGRFPCLETNPDALESIKIIHEGKIPPKPLFEMSCAGAPCLNKPHKKAQAVKARCEVSGGCPHQHSLDVAQESETIISNLHSLMYSVSLNERIDKRKILIIDECHDLQSFMRDFLKVKFKIRRRVSQTEVKDLKTTDEWVEWLQYPEQLNLLTNSDARDSYLARLERLEKIGNSVFQTWDDEKDGYLWVELWPVNVANACKSMLFSLADKIVLMSGTIYNKDLFLKPLGVDPAEAAFIRIESDFPLKNRPIVRPRRSNLDLSHKGWGRNLPQAIEDIRHLIDHHAEQKGLIHVASYKMGREIIEALDNDRVVSHTSEDFAEKLKGFYLTKEPKVFVSPVITQGVDFKDDLARWQIIVRPKYDAISDPYIEYLLKNGAWGTYNFRAAVVFGQTLGRVVRSNTDSGTTYLLSSTFNNLISKSNHLLPAWQKQSFVK